MTRHQRARRLILWGGTAAGALLWLAILIIPAVISGHITGEQPASFIQSR